MKGGCKVGKEQPLFYGWKKKMKKEWSYNLWGFELQKMRKKKRKNTSLIPISNEKDNIEGYWKKIKFLCFISNS
jgi:hypothetical protein